MPDQRRQLAAIMFTDIVGYTRLMGQNEENALTILNKNREIHQISLKEHHGKLLKELGDGMLCSFDSASDAVNSAIQLIQSSHTVNGLKLRVGIHIGEVTFSKNDVFGDGVNIASRIVSMATPDCVLISGKVYDEIKNKQNIRTKSIGIHELKNDSKPREIFAITNSPLRTPLPLGTEKKVENESETASGISPSERKFRKPGRFERPLNPRVIFTLLFTAFAAIFGAFFLVNLKENQKVKEVRQEALPKIQRLIEINNRKDAFKLALNAEKYLENDSIFNNLFSKVSEKINLNTDPTSAGIYTKFIGSPDSTYRFLGYSPLVDCRILNDYLIWKIKKPGFRTYEFLGSKYELDNKTIRLYDPDSIPDDELYIPFYGWQYRPFGSLALMKFDKWPELQDFYIDKYEVTNADYQVFVDSGGYEKKEYWDYPILNYGKEISWEEAMNSFVDLTGQRGPATWEIGNYPEGEGNYPVSGISWYEAMAYSKFKGKSLPSIYHWMYVATPLLSDYISPSSNFSKEGPTEIGHHKGIGFFGTYDMAGNVREWCRNFQQGNDKAFILGGGWSDHPYTYNIVYAQDPFDRSEINGFRCIRYIREPENSSELNKAVPIVYRDFSREKPINDEGYKLLLNQFKYDKSELNEQIDHLSVDEGKINFEKITIDAAYGNERLPMYLFLPENGTPPYQLVIHFPSTYPFSLQESASFVKTVAESNYFAKNGRALLLPVYKGALERSDNFLEKFKNMESNAFRDLMIMWVKDIGRCIDYIETRPDIDSDKIAYTGVSLGAANGVIITAIEKRFKVAVLTVAGLWHYSPPPEIDQINYLPRITIPVLMINGRYDHIFPLESSQNPLFNLLGTPDKDKKHFVYDHGHHVPQNIIIRETLNWLDTYLGPVNQKDHATQP